MSIEPISATWDCESEKTEVYRLLNMIHAMAGQSAQAKSSQWKLKETSTHSDYALTTWTNGIVDVTAETYKLNGKPIEHNYRMMETTE